MTALLRGLWPKGLAARLMLSLVLALAIAQGVLVVLLNSQRDRVVASFLHSQTLNQTVTLVRLLEDYPQSEAPKLTAAFASHELCAVVRSGVPQARTMTEQERQLATTLQTMLHDAAAGTPIVVVAASNEALPCAGAATSTVQPAATGHDDRNRAALSMDVPLRDGRWLSVHTRVDLPPEFDSITVISFLLSSFAAAIVVLVVVRRQTQSLRALANASERFGRGEEVAPLPVAGPLEVRAATHAFNTMQERLSEFIRDRLRLLASVSHDLRTPITTLRLKAEFIDDEAVRDDLIKTIDELATICEATLAFTRAEATSEDTSVLDLGELVREVEHEFILAGKPVAEAQMQPARCACRPVALKRAVRNLVENAVRYGHRATLGVSEAPGRALIRIDDEGPGIPDDRIAEAFQPFVRLETSRSTETGGIGLGLAIARSIVIAHGGTLTLGNLPGKGLRAEIALPRQG